MAEDRANNPARRPNLGLPNFVQDSMAKKSTPVVITKRTELPPALDTDVPFNERIDLAKKHLLESDHDYKESKNHG